MSDSTQAEQPSMADLMRAARVSERRQRLAARLGLTRPTEQPSEPESDDGDDDHDDAA